MDEEELQRKLEQVHDAIEQLDHVDERGRLMLRDLDGHIRDLLARSETLDAGPKPVMRRGLEEAMRHFEVTHPALTEALSELLASLSNAGI
jgi:hypothetical protein